MIQNNRLPSGNPRHAAGRNPTIGPADRLPNCDEMRVAGQPHVNSLTMPELVEAGVEIEVNPRGDRPGQRIVGQHAGDIDQSIRSAAESDEVFVRGAKSVLRPCEQQAGSIAQVKLIGDGAEIGRINRILQRRTGGGSDAGGIGSMK